MYQEIISNQKTDFSRYNYFYASYEASTGKIGKAKEIVNTALELYPRNLLLNQYRVDLNQNKNIIAFDCKKEEHVIAEILYITANALSSQSIYFLSNFYLNLAKYLNKNFYSYDTLIAENFYKTDNRRFQRLTCHVFNGNPPISSRYKKITYKDDNFAEISYPKFRINRTVRHFSSKNNFNSI